MNVSLPRAHGIVIAVKHVEIRRVNGLYGRLSTDIDLVKKAAWLARPNAGGGENVSNKAKNLENQADPIGCLILSGRARVIRIKILNIRAKKVSATVLAVIEVSFVLRGVPPNVSVVPCVARLCVEPLGVKNAGREFVQIVP